MLAMFHEALPGVRNDFSRNVIGELDCQTSNRSIAQVARDG